MKNCFQLKQHLFYSFRAKNAYAIHSPFVFKFYAEYLKRKNISKCSKTIALFSTLSFYKDKFTILKYSIYQTSNIALAAQKPNTITIVEGVYQSRSSAESWQDILNTEGNFITMDFFSIQIIVNNPDIHCKQNYILR